VLAASVAALATRVAALAARAAVLVAQVAGVALTAAAMQPAWLVALPAEVRPEWADTGARAVAAKQLAWVATHARAAQAIVARLVSTSRSTAAAHAAAHAVARVVAAVDADGFRKYT